MNPLHSKLQKYLMDQGHTLVTIKGNNVVFQERIPGKVMSLKSLVITEALKEFGIK